MMTKPKPVSASKLKILHATARVAQAVGASNVTLTRIAREAGISKGGLLYHYPNKRALLEGMLDHSLSEVGERLLVAETSGTTLRDFVLADVAQSAQDRAIQQSLLAAAAEDPNLLAPARSVVGRWLALATSHSNQALLIFLASEGARFLDLLNLMPSAAMRKSILQSIANAANPTEGDAA